MDRLRYEHNGKVYEVDIRDLGGGWVEVFVNGKESYFVHGNLFSLTVSKKAAANAEVVLEVFPTGPWEENARKTLRKRDAIRVYGSLGSGEVREELVRHYYTEQLVEGDICFYCGHNNGPQGEDRVGWDCGWCGGN